jgi:hypothetical protein
MVRHADRAFSARYLHFTMTGLDPATQQPRVCAANGSIRNDAR